MNRPYYRVKFRVFSTTDFEEVVKLRSYWKCLGSKKTVRKLNRIKQQSNLTSDKE